MSDFLSIREFAKMMGVSIHQVRYFEEKGLLLPAYIEPNGYRRYGTDEMYRLAHILLLRELDVPVAEAGRALSEYGEEEYEELIGASLERVRGEIARLQRLERFTEELLQERNRSRIPEAEGELKLRPLRRLRRWVTLAADGQGPTARELLEASERPERLFETDLFYIRQGRGTALYFETADSDPSQKGDLLLEQGLYWCEAFAAADDNEVELRIEAACGQVRERFGLQPDRLMLKEKSYLSLFGGEAVQVELEIPVGARKGREESDDGNE